MNKLPLIHRCTCRRRNLNANSRRLLVPRQHTRILRSRVYMYAIIPGAAVPLVGSFNFQTEAFYSRRRRPGGEERFFRDVRSYRSWCSSSRWNERLPGTKKSLPTSNAIHWIVSVWCLYALLWQRNEIVAFIQSTSASITSVWSYCLTGIPDSRTLAFTTRTPLRQGRARVRVIFAIPIKCSRTKNRENTLLDDLNSVSLYLRQTNDITLVASHLWKKYSAMSLWNLDIQIKLIQIFYSLIKCSWPSLLYFHFFLRHHYWFRCLRMVSILWSSVVGLTHSFLEQYVLKAGHFVFTAIRLKCEP